MEEEDFVAGVTAALGLRLLRPTLPFGIFRKVNSKRQIVLSAEILCTLGIIFTFF